MYATRYHSVEKAHSAIVEIRSRQKGAAVLEIEIQESGGKPLGRIN